MGLSPRELEQTAGRYIDRHNVAPKPLIWTKTADQILSASPTSVTGLMTQAASVGAMSDVANLAPRTAEHQPAA